MQTGQDSTTALLHELDELHLNGGAPAFQQLLNKICSRFISNGHADLEARVLAEATGLKRLDDPLVGTTCKHIQACRRTLVARQQETERARRSRRRITIRASDAKCDN